jgi:hypothetical protein
LSVVILGRDLCIFEAKKLPLLSCHRGSRKKENQAASLSLWVPPAGVGGERTKLSQSKIVEDAPFLTCCAAGLHTCFPRRVSAVVLFHLTCRQPGFISSCGTEPMLNELVWGLAFDQVFLTDLAGRRVRVEIRRGLTSKVEPSLGGRASCMDLDLLAKCLWTSPSKLNRQTNRQTGK